MSSWQLVYEGFDPQKESLREALCTLGNGVFATRGAAPESEADEIHYPGTYAPGLYNRLVTRIAGRDVENEDLVNLPNWLPLTWRIDEGPWFRLADVEILDYRQVLDLRRALLTRTMRVRDAQERITEVTQHRFVSMARPHLAALRTELRAVDWTGRLEIRSALDGAVANTGVRRYRALRHQHLAVRGVEVCDDETIALDVETNQSHREVSLAARTRVSGGRPVASTTEERLGKVATQHVVEVAPGDMVDVEKVAALFTSRAPAISEPGIAARDAVRRAGSFDDLLSAHETAWAALWDRYELEVGNGSTRAELVLRLHVFHLLTTVSSHTIPYDVGVPARGWHGEAYRGHIFWDELFIFPFLNVRAPELTRALLLYRYRRLQAARINARSAGYEGAMFPWQSGSDGREETQVVHLNPASGRWIEDGSHLQRHVNVAIAMNVLEYFHVTGDTQFMASFGAELYLDIARFLASIAELDEADGRYHIRGVMGPDEYHEGYPDRNRPGLDDNAYTNVMAVWVLRNVPALLDTLPVQARHDVIAKLGITEADRRRWADICRRMHVPFHAVDGEGGAVLSQFAGYEQLEEFDWAGYRERYGNIARLDRILEAEGDSTDRYRLSKQADVVMLFYLLDAEELSQLLSELGYELDEELIPRTIDYYMRRTSHGSTLSRVTHAWVLSRRDREQSWNLFVDALESDISDIQGGTTSEGIHLGAMAGTVDLVQRCYGGFRVRDGVIDLNPQLPAELGLLAFTVRFRHVWGLRLVITQEEVTVTAPPYRGPTLQVRLGEDSRRIAPGETQTWLLPHGDRVAGDGVPAQRG